MRVTVAPVEAGRAWGCPGSIPGSCDQGAAGPWVGGRHRDRMNDSIDTRLVDEAVDAYVDWREECLAVWADRPQCCALVA